MPKQGLKSYPKWIEYYKKWGAKFPNFFTCLVQASALKLILGKNQPHLIHFGVRTHPAFEAHAWVEINKEVILGEEHYEGYKKIWSW